MNSHSDPSDPMNWAAAATLMTLSVSLRCARDFRYYRSQDPRKATGSELAGLCKRLQRNAYSLQNLLTDLRSRDENQDDRTYCSASGCRPDSGSVTGPLRPHTGRTHLSALPFLFILGRAIHDDLETLHRELLFSDPGKLAEVIPLIDRQRRFWADYNRTCFYDPELAGWLEQDIPADFREIGMYVRSITSGLQDR